MVSAEHNNDVEMKSLDSPSAENSESGSGDAKKDSDLLTVEDIREHMRQIEKAVHSKEPRFILRVLRSLPNTRRKLNASVLRKIISSYYSQRDREQLMAFIDEPMEVDGTNNRTRTAPRNNTTYLPEVDCYLTLLILLKLLDNTKYNEAVQCADLLFNKVCSQNRRTLDLIAARCYFYLSQSYEMIGQLGKIKSKLHGRLRTATLRNDYEGQAVLINCLLRNYLHHHLYDQADKLVSKSVFPELASNNEWARYLYYLGRIKAIQLDYSAAHKHLLQAMRKAPQLSAVGFKQTVQKLTITVELLLGEITERQTFRQVTMRKALHPYFLLTHAVRMGNLQEFTNVLQTYAATFQKDNTYTLILRLRHNVIKTALRSISLSYSRISLEDIAQKLMLDSPVDAEFIVAKTIRDGVIEATLDHEQGYMQSKETTDLYRTREPQHAFHHRIVFCLDIHNQSVKAMRYPPKAYHKDLESAEERREREQQDLELAKEMAEDDDDGFP